MVKIWQEEQESVDITHPVFKQFRLVTIVVFRCRNIFLAHSGGRFVLTENHLNSTAYTSIVAGHVHPFITTVFF